MAAIQIGNQLSNWTKKEDHQFKLIKLLSTTTATTNQMSFLSKQCNPCLAKNIKLNQEELIASQQQHQQYHTACSCQCHLSASDKIATNLTANDSFDSSPTITSIICVFKHQSSQTTTNSSFVLHCRRLLCVYLQLSRQNATRIFKNCRNKQTNKTRICLLFACRVLQHSIVAT